VALTAQGANIPPQILIELSPLQASIKRKLLALLEKPDPMAEQAKQIAVAAETAKVRETDSKTHLNEAKAAEIGQGGAHGIVERQMDLGMKREEHQMKQAESVMKLQTEREKGRIKIEGEFDKLQSQKEKARQDLTVNAAKGSMQLAQSQDKHALAMRQQAAKPKANGASRP
jgi:hypothetical protein